MSQLNIHQVKKIILTKSKSTTKDGTDFETITMEIFNKNNKSERIRDFEITLFSDNTIEVEDNTNEYD